MNIKDALERLKTKDAEVVRLGQIIALLEWDQETYMPEEASKERAAQTALLAGMRHERIIDAEWSDLFSAVGIGEEGALNESSAPNPQAAESAGEVGAAFFREVHKRWKKAVNVPKKLVEDLARETSLSQSAWVNSRKNDDYDSFAPHLATVIELEKEYAAAVSPEGDIYDTLLDDYEPGARGDRLSVLFDELLKGLNPILESILSQSAVFAPFLEKSFPIDKQDLFGKRIQEFMGFDAKRGRLDLSAHPFTTTLGPDDVRVTTRYDEKNVFSGLFSNIHEAGHGLYEQGMGLSVRGTSLGDGASLGIHESQSRFWENIVGRSRAFWDFWFHDFYSLFPDCLEGVGVEDFYRAVNIVRPSLIRVDADEVTYSYHIIIRFRLERALISGDLTVDDLPGAWRESYKKYLGIEPMNDADGCLQDVHWSCGLLGYFPTYALGNLYAAQFANAMEKEIGSLDDVLRRGDSGAVLGWLRREIHEHGRIHTPENLCRRVTGDSVNPTFFLDYLRTKYRAD